MPRLFCAALLLALAFGCGPANGQVPDADRVAQIVANIEHEVPPLAGQGIRVDSLAASGIDGWDRGVLTIPNRGVQPFLVSEDTKTLYFLASDALDVSRSSASLAGARAEREAAERAETLALADRLRAAAAGLPARGNPDAPITIVEFSDFECSFCKRASGTVDEVLAQNPDVKLVYMHFPLQMHPWAEPAAIASTCAAQQSDDAFWTLHDAYFENQRTLSTQNVVSESLGYLQASGLDLAAWSTCVTDTSSEAHRQASAAVSGQMALGDQLGVRGTPAFFIEGQLLSGAQPASAFAEVLQGLRVETD